MEKKILTINGEAFTDIEEFYIEMDRVLTKNLNWKTGHNLDALNDLLRGGFGVFEYEEPIVLIWESSEKSKVNLGYEAMVKRFEKIIRECHPTNVDRVKEQLSNAKQKKGTTFFEYVIEIIEEHEHIQLILK